MITVVDAGIGHVKSVANMFLYLGHDAETRSSPRGLSASDRIVLPGVGSYDAGVSQLKLTGWFSYLQDLLDEVHLLGICLGMQLLGLESEESDSAGLG